VHISNLDNRLRKRRGSPLNNQCIFIPIVVWGDTIDLKSFLEVEGLCPLITFSHLCPYPFKIGGVHRPIKEFCANASSPVVRVDGDRDDVPIDGVDDIPYDLAFLPVMGRVDIDQKGFWINIVEIDKGSPVVRGFWKGLGFDLEDSVKVSEGEGTYHWRFFVPPMMEAMPPVNLWKLTFSNPAPLIISS